ncbi:gliding motility-associated C-terminal domain-containing protein [Hymenobacter sp. ASUV-10]|uniref:Gliding motility-associated C-terminal domain-containing protein n=1 Tax=Hymenobacter aranciens TaxID=3063996 RepID=A0ABT9B8F1_9BACT|nr:gliding motility-associated C-terminal domain-containing protein [Hymenobacter sp. ASUV-10]MDO7874473.1 gliding motility-associated C-terminal domain-containing protein [Hymenobacter sp. ASUV-10]
MKKNYASAALWLLTWVLLLGAAPRAFATHGQAGQITYESLGNNQYRVTVSFFRDCSGTSIPGTLSLTCRNSGSCSGTAAASATLRPVGQSTIGAPYCPGTQGGNVCGGGSALPNYETRLYQGTVTLPPAAEWVLSVTIDARPYTATLLDSNNQNLRMEATLNNLITLPGNATQPIQNNSPQFNNTNLPVPFVCVNQQSTISFGATDTDRLNNGRADSLVYSLEQPLHNCNVLSRYETYPAPPCASTTLSTTPPCALQCPTTPLAFSPTLPIIVKMDTVGTCPTKRVVPSFYFNAEAGSFTFTPSRYVPLLQSTRDQMENKYVVVGKVTEYRKINGRYYKVGSVRRDFLVIVVDCGSNQVPANPISVVPDPRTDATVINQRDTTLISIPTCTYSRVSITFRDPNPQDLLTVFFPADINTNLLQNGDIGTFTLVRNGTANPVGTFSFQPLPGTAGTRILLNYRIEDNACPIKGTQYRTIIVQVRPGRQVQAGAAIATPGLDGSGVASICPGGSLPLNGRVLRPDSVRQGGAVIPQTYAYRWTTSPGGTGLNPAQASSPGITVNPTATTRYFLQITPSIAPGPGCGLDTTSVLVRVVPPPRAVATASANEVCSNSSVTLQGSATRADNLSDAYAYTWAGAGLPATASGPSLTAQPAATTRYYLTVTGAAPYGCRDTTSVLVRVARAPLAAFRTDSASGTGSIIRRPPITYTFINQSTAGGTASDSVRWTYQRLRNGLGQPLTEPEVVFSRQFTPAPLTLSLGGNYLIRLRVSSTAGGATCPAATASYHAVIPTTQVPNIITPNGDQLNETFVVSGEKVGGELKIFNRWGRLVAEFANYQNQWNAAGLADGVYYYHLTDPLGQASKGMVEVLR